MRLKDDYRSEQSLFAAEAFEEDESEEFLPDDPSTSQRDIAEHMLARDGKKLIYSYEESRRNTPAVSGVKIDAYSQLRWMWPTVKNTLKEARGVDSFWRYLVALAVTSNGTTNDINCH